MERRLAGVVLCLALISTTLVVGGCSQGPNDPTIKPEEQKAREKGYTPDQLKRRNQRSQ